jgi:gluconolactonase
MPGGLLRVPTFADQPGKPIDYLGGSLQRVDLAKGTVETVCDNPFRSPEGLRSPDDLVFDESGGCWLTDWGKEWCATREYGAIRYLARGAKEPVIVNTNAHARRNAPNGIALSKDGRTLYAAETYARWTRKWSLSAPGAIVTNPLVLDSSELHCASFPHEGRLDSMKMDDAGNLWVVTILTYGLNPTKSGGISIVSPDGQLLEYLEINAGMPDPLPSNLCFGGADRQTLFVTLGGTGRVVCCRVSAPGLALNWQSY